MRSYLKLDKMHHISENKFRLINWLPTSNRVDQRINTIMYNFSNNPCPYYLNDILNLPSIVGEAHETTFPNLKILFVKQTWDKTHFLNINSSIWNSFLDSIKKVNSLNTFRHNVKK